VQIDAPKHPKLRRLTQDWFMPKNLVKLEGEIRKIANAAVDRLLAHGNGGFHQAGVLALSAARRHADPRRARGGRGRMLVLTQQMFGGQDEDLSQSGLKNLTPEQIAQIVAGAVKDFEAISPDWPAIAAQSTDDLATVIANAVIDGEPMSDRDTAGYYIITASAGHDTTSASTAGAMLALARDPEQFARVKADRGLLAGIVEEAIR
jgi:cytochrome P450